MVNYSYKFTFNNQIFGIELIARGKLCLKKKNLKDGMTKRRT